MNARRRIVYGIVAVALLLWLWTILKLEAGYQPSDVPGRDVNKDYLTPRHRPRF